jgi:hypothetical protein
MHTADEEVDDSRQEWVWRGMVVGRERKKGWLTWARCEVDVVRKIWHKKVMWNG